jgi:hypothetical protein
MAVLDVRLLTSGDLSLPNTLEELRKNQKITRKTMRHAASSPVTILSLGFKKQARPSP